MGRLDQPPAPAFPPIPRNLYPLINEDGNFRWGGFIPGRRDPRWQAYKRLKSEYCAEAGIQLWDFRAACQADPKFVEHHRG